MEGIFSPQSCPIYKADTIDEYINHLTNILSSSHILTENKNKAKNYIDALNQHIKNILKQIL